MIKNFKLLLTFLVVSAFLTNCGGTTDSQIKGKSYQSEGWLDNDTFQVRGLGAPNPDSVGLVKRKSQAKNAALIAAQARVVELMIGAEIKGATGSSDGESTGIVLTKEFQGVVKGGSIVEETFDDEQNCEVVYQVTGKNLKKRVKDTFAGN